VPSENLVEENIQENTIIENEENINNQIVEDTPEVVERQLDDFESRLKRLTGDD
jgi:fructose-1-phosphate kinase PfkB-like protein